MTKYFARACRRPGSAKQLVLLLVSVLVLVSSFPLSAQDVRIHFPVNGTTLLTDKLDNRAALERLDSLVYSCTPALTDTLLIVGHASPEGSAILNRVLTTRRAKSVSDYITKKYPFLSSKISVTTLEGSWEEFRGSVVDDTVLSDAMRERILGIIDADLQPYQKEKRLRALPAWSLIRERLLPQFRYAAISLILIHEGREILLGEGLLLEEIPAELFEQPAISLQPDRLTVPALVGAPSRARARRVGEPVFGLSTNILYDATYFPHYGFTSIPSVSLEYYPRRGRMTYGVDVEWPMWQHWDTHRFMQINNITLWTRRYFKPKADDRFRGTYLFASANVARFGIGYDMHGWEGEGLGASLGLGRKWILGRSRFYLDAGLAVGALYSRYDPYVFGNDATKRYYYDYAGDPDLFIERNHRWLWIGPTRAYVSLGIDLINRNRRRAAR